MSPQISGMIQGPEVLACFSGKSPRDRETWTTRTEKPCIWLKFPKGLLGSSDASWKPSLLFHATTQNKSFMIIPTFQERPPQLEVGLQTHLTIRTDPVVCPDCNIEDSLSSNMRRELAENTRIPSFFCIRIQSFQGFRV